MANSARADATRAGPARLEADRTRDPRLHALVEQATELIGPLPCGTVTDDGPMTCARVRIGGDVLEFFALVARFDSAHEVTLSELRVELMYPGNEVAARWLGIDEMTTASHRSDEPVEFGRT